MMSDDLEKDQSSTRFEEGDPSEDATNQNTLQETTLEAPEEQSEIQGTTSESDHETSDGQFSPSEQDFVAILSSSSIDSIGFSLGQASPTVSDVVQLDRQYFEVSSGKTPPAERDFVAQLVRFIGGVEIPIRPTRGAESGVEVASIEKASQDKTGIEVLDLDGKVPSEGNRIKAQFERQSIPSDSGVRFDGPDAVDDTNLNTPVTKQSLCDDTTGESSAAQDLKKNITVALVKIRTASDKLNTRAQETGGRIETPINERAMIHLAEIKAFQTKSSAVIEMKTSFTQQTISAVDGKTPLTLTPSVAEGENVPFTETSFVRTKIQLTQQVPSTIAGVRGPLTEVQSGVAEMKASLADAPSAFEGRKEPLSEVSSAAAGMKAPPIQPAVAGKRSQLTNIPSAAAGMTAPLTRQAPANSEKKESFTQQASPAATRIKEPLTKVPSAAAGMTAPLTRQAPAISEKKEPFTQQASPAVTRIKEPLTEVPSSAAAGMKTPLTQQSPPAVTGIKEPLVEVPSAAAGTSTTSQQASSAIPARRVKLTAACLPSWSNITMQQARRGRASGSKAPQTRQASLTGGRRVHPSFRNLPELNVQNIRTGLQGREYQKLFPSETMRAPYRSLSERMYLEAVYGVRKVVDITKEKKKKKKRTKKKKRSRYACDDDDNDLSEGSRTSDDEPKSPPEPNQSSPELQFHLEL